VASLGRLVKPDVAVILAARLVHRKGFRTIEAVAAEKGALLGKLRRNGIAVLNGDDPLVDRMPAPRGVRVLRFGTAPEHDCRAAAAECRWPQRLTLEVAAGGKQVAVRTRLVGEMWTASVLAAITAAVACGTDLTEAADALASVEPALARMQPVTLPSGAVMLRDDKGAQVETLAPALRVLREADTERRVVVLGDISDSPRGHQDRMRLIGRLTAESADMAVFVDVRGDVARRIAIHHGLAAENAHHFVNARDAAEFLRGALRPGDLVLLKGRISQHLARIYLAQVGPVDCRKTLCSKQSMCDHCPELKNSFHQL
jgi:UDP-N-acetylmuramyl pentapeptide synthase